MHSSQGTYNSTTKEKGDNGSSHLQNDNEKNDCCILKTGGKEGGRGEREQEERDRETRGQGRGREGGNNE